jgi:hypothetical protein
MTNKEKLAELKEDLIKGQKSLASAKEAEDKASIGILEELVSDIEQEIAEFKEEVVEEKKEEKAEKAEEKKEAVKETPKVVKKTRAKRQTKKEEPKPKAKRAVKKVVEKPVAKKPKQGTPKSRAIERLKNKKATTKKPEKKMGCKELLEKYHNRKAAAKKAAEKNTRPVLQRITENVEDAFTAAITYNKKQGNLNIPKLKIAAASWEKAIKDMKAALSGKFENTYIEIFAKKLKELLKELEGHKA